jgi:hypothetical protein
MDPTYTVLTASPENKFMFAVEIWMVNTTGPERYFDVNLIQYV